MLYHHHGINFGFSGGYHAGGFEGGGYHADSFGGGGYHADSFGGGGYHADSFGVIRGGHIDVTVMGAYQVSMTGDFANWKLKGQKGGGIGGAMDLAACAKRVFIILEHVTRSGEPRLVTACDLPVTARGVVTLVATNYGLFQPTGTGFLLREIAPGFTVDDIRATTGGILTVADNLKQIATH